MAWHGYACCSDLPPCPNCVESCDFATSYVIDGFQFFFDFARDYGNCVKCAYEGGGGGGSFMQESYSIHVELLQLAPVVLQRFGTPGVTPCHYRACGTFELSWQVEEQATFGCCKPETDPGIAVECNDSQQMNGAEAVSFCYYVYCAEMPLDACRVDTKGKAVWKHVLRVCGTQMATFHENYVADCNDVEQSYDCGVEPGGRLFLDGMTMVWYTPLVDLATLAPADHDPIMGPYGSDAFNANCVCGSDTLTDERVAPAQCGPWAVSKIPDAAPDPFDPCADGIGATQLARKYPTHPICFNDENCNEGLPTLCGDGSIKCNCVRYDSGWSAVWWTYV